MNNHSAFIGLGSNLGSPTKFITQALSLFPMHNINIIAISSFYKNKPIGFSSQNMFVNACAHISTPLNPQMLLNALNDIELSLGRLRSSNNVYSDRTIDLDILLFDNDIFHSHCLTIPHPKMHLRRFVLQPLADIAPDIVHPVLKKSIRSLLLDCNDISKLHVILNP